MNSGSGTPASTGHSSQRHWLILVIALTVAIVLWTPALSWGNSDDVVYVESNSTNGNSILAFRNTGSGTEIAMMRWGMPPPLRTGGPPVTNIRNTSSPHWRGWLKPENRCLVPFNSFAEYAPEPLPGDAFKIVMRGADKEDKSAAMKKAGGQ